MKLFIDTANLVDIEEALRGGYIRGITTNPSLLAKEPKGNYLKHMEKIVALARQYSEGVSLSVEVFTNDQQEMIAQAQQFVEALNYEHLAIKIPISYKGESNLEVVRGLAQRGIAVNVTACMTPLQLMMAAASGARFVSLFYNRLKDGAAEPESVAERDALLSNKIVEQGHFDPDLVLRETRALLADYPQAEIITGSIRSPLDVLHAGVNGSHIVTASLKILKQSLMHFKTDHSIDGFLKDFESWIK
jgi:transaldolase